MNILDKEAETTLVIAKLKNRARAEQQHIVLPEGEDKRAITAAARVAAEGYAKIPLRGRPKNIEAPAQEMGVKLPSASLPSAPLRAGEPGAGVSLLDPAASPNLEKYVQIYYERRRARGV